METGDKISTVLKNEEYLKRWRREERTLQKKWEAQDRVMDTQGLEVAVQDGWR